MEGVVRRELVPSIHMLQLVHNSTIEVIKPRMDDNTIFHLEMSIFVLNMHK